MGLMMKTFNIFWVHWKANFKGGLQFADLRGAWQDRGGCCFWGGVDTLMHTMPIFDDYPPSKNIIYMNPLLLIYDNVWNYVNLLFLNWVFWLFLPVLIISIPSSQKSIFSLPSGFPSCLVSVSLVWTDGSWCKAKYH